MNKFTAVLLVCFLCTSCAAPKEENIQYREGSQTKTAKERKKYCSDGGLSYCVWKIIDHDAGVVCYRAPEAVSCIPIFDTKHNIDPELQKILNE